MLVKIRDEEIPAIVLLINEAYRGVTAAANWTSESGYIEGNRTTEKMIRQELIEDPQSTVLKWQDDQDDTVLLGTVTIKPLENGEWYIGSLATDPKRQNSGLGKQLLSLSEQWIARKGGKMIQLTVVNIRIKLIEWYIRRGYHLTTETQAFPYGDNRWGIPLRDDLSFVILKKEVTPS